MFPGGASAIVLTKNELPSHSDSIGSLSSTSAGDHTHSYDDPGHNDKGSTSSGAFSGGTFSMNPRGVGGNDQGLHSSTISRDYTRINIQQAEVHSHTIVGEIATVGGRKVFSIMPPYQNVNYIIYVRPALSENIG